MSRRGASHFRFPDSLGEGYRRWTSPDFEGWIDVALFEQLEAGLETDPELLFRLPGGRVERDKRNLTMHVRLGNASMWVKRFRPRSSTDRLMYAPGPGKAAYAWNAAMALTERGFHTPRPLIGLRGSGGWGGADGIVAFQDVDDHAPLDDWLSDAPPERTDRDSLLQALGERLKRFHDLGFRHRDLRRGNLLAARRGRDWSIYFLDLNRLRVQSPLTTVQRLREVERLNLPAGGLVVFFRAYMPEHNSDIMAETYLDRVAYADRLERLPLGRLFRKAWYYSWELRAFSRARRP